MAKENNKLNMGSIQEIHALEQRIFNNDKILGIANN